MTYVHKGDLNDLLNKSNDDISAEVGKWVEPENMDDVSQRKVKELSHMLRKRKKPELAAQVAGQLYDKKETPDNLNLYFVAVVDTGNAAKIKELDKEAEKCVNDSKTDAEQRRHLYATRLKAANRIQDDKKFEEIYGEIPAEDKTGNNYIANQYYIYLNRNKRYQEIVAHYDTLNFSVREDKRIQERYKDALGKIGAVKDSSVFLIGSNLANLQIPALILESLRVRVIKITGDTPDDILSKMEADNSESRFAVAYKTEFDEFAWGYLLGKVGASNLVLITDDKNAGNAFSSHGFKEPAIVDEHENLDEWKRKLADLMKAGGLNVFYMERK